jgi:6-pyruvoyltetrahydropterin/6-carboxytetrahydropterin synthase
MYTISKNFEFDYGHRVHNQLLDKTHSIDDKCVCRHLHGHRGVITVTLCAEVLERGMVTDFKHLNWFKEWVNNTLDHKMILDWSDPMRETFVPYSEGKPKKVEYNKETGIRYFDMTGEAEVRKDFYEGNVFVDFVPTSERMCLWLMQILVSHFKDTDIKVMKVEFSETPKTKACYDWN